MSGALARAAAVAARRLTGQGASSSSSSSSAVINLQRRFAGDLPVKSNPFVERWGTSREHIEDTFFFDRKNFARAAAWVFGFPLAVYFGIVKDFESADERAGKASGKQRPPMLGRDDRPEAGPAAH